MFYNKKVILLIYIFSCFASNCGAMEYCIKKGLIADVSKEKVNNLKSPNKKLVFVDNCDSLNINNSNNVSNLDFLPSSESIMERLMKEGAISTSIFNPSTTTLGSKKLINGVNNFNSISVHNGGIKFNESFFTYNTDLKKNNHYRDSEMKRIYQLKKLRDYETLLKKNDINSAKNLKSEIVRFGLESETPISKRFSKVGERIRNIMRVLNLINKVVEDYDNITGDPGSYFDELHKKIRKLFNIEVGNLFVGNRFTLDSVDKLKGLFKKSKIDVDVEFMLIRFPDRLESFGSDFMLNNKNSA